MADSAYGTVAYVLVAVLLVVKLRRPWAEWYEQEFDLAYRDGEVGPLMFLFVCACWPVLVPFWFLVVRRETLSRQGHPSLLERWVRRPHEQAKARRKGLG